MRSLQTDRSSHSAGAVRDHAPGRIRHLARCGHFPPSLPSIGMMLQTRTFPPSSRTPDKAGAVTHPAKLLIIPSIGYSGA